MLDPKEIAAFDQGQAFLTEALPPVLWGLYSNSVKEGFTEEHAIRIVLAYINVLSPGGTGQ